jgi:hypothetical protein
MGKQYPGWREARSTAARALLEANKPSAFRPNPASLIERVEPYRAKLPFSPHRLPFLLVPHGHPRDKRPRNAPPSPGTDVAHPHAMRTLLPVLGLLASAACAGENSDVAPALSTTSASTHVHMAINPAASFNHYRTYSFGPAEGPPAGYKTSPRSDELQRRLLSLIATDLEKKGYAPAAGKGDVVIMFGSGRREVATHDESDITAEWIPDDENADFVEGSLVIDAFDGAKGTKVWHGASLAKINPDKLDEQRLRRSVDELVAAFPPQGGP